MINMPINSIIMPTHFFSELTFEMDSKPIKSASNEFFAFLRFPAVFERVADSISHANGKFRGCGLFRIMAPTHGNNFVGVLCLPFFAAFSFLLRISFIPQSVVSFFLVFIVQIFFRVFFYFIRVCGFPCRGVPCYAGNATAIAVSGRNVPIWAGLAGKISFQTKGNGFPAASRYDNIRGIHNEVPSRCDRGPATVPTVQGFVF